VSARPAPSTVIAGLDPAIQIRFRRKSVDLDCRVATLRVGPAMTEKKQA